MVPPEESDSALVARALRNEALATEQLVRRHPRAAVSVAMALLGDRAGAEDVAQEALVVAFERLDTCREPERFVGWLLRLVRHRALNARTRGKVHERSVEQLVPSETAQAPLDAERVGLRKRLLQGVQRLSPQRREVVVLHDLEGGWVEPEVDTARAGRAGSLSGRGPPCLLVMRSRRRSACGTGGVRNLATSLATASRKAESFADQGVAARIRQFRQPL